MSESTPAQYTVLLIEDEPDINKLTSKAIERGGFTVRAAHSGPEGIKIALNEPIHG